MPTLHEGGGLSKHTVHCSSSLRSKGIVCRLTSSTGGHVLELVERVDAAVVVRSQAFPVPKGVPVGIVIGQAGPVSYDSA